MPQKESATHHKMIEELRLKGPLEVIWSNTLLKAGQMLKLGQVTEALCSTVLSVSKDGDPMASLGNTVQCLIALINFFSST